MKKQNSTYINPLTDFGFKKLFGEEVNKEFLIDFLNSLLMEEQGLIIDLKYQSTEQIGISQGDRSAIYDLYCTNEKGDHFIVELQRANQTFFLDRTIYYSSFLIQKQGKRKTNWNYKLKSIYTIAILDFKMSQTVEKADKYYYKVKLTDIETNEIIYPKLTFIYVELPKFTKEATQLLTHFDKWLYLFQNLSTLNEIPINLKENIFMKLLEKAKLENLPEIERKNYQASLKRYRDTNSVIETAKLEGLTEGHAKGYDEGLDQGLDQGISIGIDKEKNQVIKNAHEEGLSIALIAKLTGLTEDEIITILKRLF